MSVIPKNLAVYYGYMSLINGANGNIPSAVASFSAYDQVIVGDGLEDPTHPDYANTQAIVNDPSMVNTQVFGYINSTLSLDVIQDKIDQWYAIGNIAGIFMDQFGYDYNVTREQQREIVWCIHEKGTGNLKAFVNAWNVDDAFSPAVDSVNNPNGLATRLGANDFYLAESFAVINGVYDDADTDSNGIKDWQDKAAKMSAYNTTYGTNMCAVATQGAVAFDQNMADYSYYASALNNFYSWGWGEQYYSASSCVMPFIQRKIFYGNRFDSAVTITGNVYERRTNVGIHVDTSAHTVDILLA